MCRSLVDSRRMGGPESWVEYRTGEGVISDMTEEISVHDESADCRVPGSPIMFTGENGNIFGRG